MAALALGASLVLALAAPLAAQAGPLLSGYGGPGQGNQAILGSTLIGGPGGGSGSSGGGPEAGAAATAPAQATSGIGTAQAGATRTRGAGSSSRGGHGAGGAAIAGARAAQTTLAGELGDRSYRGYENAGSSSALGLSGADIAYIVLAAAALVVTGLLTRRLAGAKAAKGHS
jgi:hypothetical protein